MQRAMLIAAMALVTIPIWANDEERITVSEKVGDGALVLTYPREDASNWKDDPASLSVDEDIRINGVLLRAGNYDFYPEVVSENDWHFVFSGLDSQGIQDELLRVAILPEKGATALSSLAFNGVKDQARTRRADLVLQWHGKNATLGMILTGQRRDKGLDPDLPEETREAWAIVKASLDALVATDLNQHARDFAEDFESDLSDGGGKLAHLQNLWHILDDYSFLGMGLNFEQLEIDIGENELTFRNLIAYGSEGPLKMSYRLLKRNDQWQVRNFGFEEEENEEDDEEE
jgi:hypothetical protein